MTQNPIPIDLDRLLPDALSEILKLQDNEAFQRWMKRHVYEYLEDASATPAQQDLFAAPDQATPDDLLQSFATLFAHALWNITPLPDNDFRPRPLPKPGRNDPCPCGSGLKFKRCCQAAYEELPPMTTEHIWPLLMEIADRETLNAAVASGRMPVDQLTELALEHLAEGRPKKAAQLLEPLFSDGLSGTSESHDFALNTLLDVYDRLGYRHKKRELLEFVLREADRSPLRSGAWQRLATIRMDQGDHQGAWEAVEQARRDTPNDPYVGILEIQLLLTENRNREALERARFWRRKLKGKQKVDEEILEFFDRVAEDPQQAFLEMTSPMTEGLDLRLEAWIRANIHRPLPHYRIECAEQRAGEEKPPCFLEPPPELEPLPEEWQENYPAEEPFSVGGFDLSFNDPWDPETAEEWLNWLENHPEAFDSIDILADLAEAVEQNPRGSPPGSPASCWYPCCSALSTSSRPPWKATKQCHYWSGRRWRTDLLCSTWNG